MEYLYEWEKQDCHSNESINSQKDFLKRLNIKKRKIVEIAIFLYQTLKQYSYREVLQELKYLGFKTLSLNK
jgi:hypothetical protein